MRQDRTAENAYDPPAVQAPRRDSRAGWSFFYRVATWVALAGLLGLAALWVTVSWLLPTLFDIELIGIGPS